MKLLFRETALIVGNDLRLGWRNLIAGKLGAFISGSLVGLVLLVLQAIAIGVFLVLRPHPSAMAETAVWLFFAFLGLGAALNQAIVVLFQRSDFDLLLASPLSARAILLARLATIATAAAVGSGFLLVPALNAAIVEISWRYAAGYLVWAMISCVAGSASIWMAALLIRWVGARRARVWIQVVAALAAAAVYLLIQTAHLLPTLARGSVARALSAAVAKSGVTVLAHAARGEPIALAVVLLITLASVAATLAVLDRLFVAGVQGADESTTPRRRASRRRAGFQEGVRRATFLKDLRLIARDPLLLAQLLPNVVYFIPAFFVLWRFGAATVLCLIATFVATQFSFLLAAVAASGEECWDLIRMSPTAERELRQGKLSAATALPVASAVLLSLAAAAMGHPWTALLTLVFSVAAATAAAWLQVTRITPTLRRDVLQRGRRRTNLARHLVVMLLTLVASAGVGCAATGHPLASILMLGLTTLIIIACFTLVGIEEIHDWPESRSTSPQRA